jgi:hypothetical protein
MAFLFLKSGPGVRNAIRTVIQTLLGGECNFFDVIGVFIGDNGR